MKFWLPFISGAVSGLTLGVLERLGVNFWLALVCGVTLGVAVSLVLRFFVQRRPAEGRK